MRLSLGLAYWQRQRDHGSGALHGLETVARDRVVRIRSSGFAIARRDPRELLVFHGASEQDGVRALTGPVDQCVVPSDDKLLRDASGLHALFIAFGGSDQHERSVSPLAFVVDCAQK